MAKRLSGEGLTMLAKLGPLNRSLLSAFAGFLFYGAWAYLVNALHGSMVALKAACVQGGYSFALTFGMTLLLEATYGLFSQRISPVWLSNCLTITVSCAVIFSTSWWVNVMAGTPEIFRTVILGYVVGLVYTISYVRGLSNASKNEPETIPI